MKTVLNNTTPGASSMGAPTLVVVDLQEWIASSGLIGDTVTKAGSLVEHARANEWPIVFLKINSAFRPHNPVAESLVRIVDGYTRCTERTKDGMGGGNEVLAACADGGYAVDRFVICGVWLKGCVLQTVRELCLRHPQAIIQVVADACNNEESEWRSLFEELPNVFITSLEQMQAE
jgi:nicotinamidase-related amidase